MVTNISHYTPDDLLDLPDEGLFELVDGELMEKQMSSLAGRTAAIIIQRLMNHLDQTRAGELMVETTFRCFPDDPDRVRRPDIAFVAADDVSRLPPEGHIPFAPHLVIEVISPGDRINDFEERLADYRSAGVARVWEVNPTFRCVRVHHPDGSTVLLQSNDALDGEDVLKGFSPMVRDLMPE